MKPAYVQTLPLPNAHTICFAQISKAKLIALGPVRVSWLVQWTPSSPATLGTSQSVLISYSRVDRRGWDDFLGSLLFLLWYTRTHTHTHAVAGGGWELCVGHTDRVVAIYRWNSDAKKLEMLQKFSLPGQVRHTWYTQHTWDQHKMHPTHLRPMWDQHNTLETKL